MCPNCFPALLLLLPVRAVMNESQVCSICEQPWLSEQLEEHSVHCALLRTIEATSKVVIDEQLTMIANILEEWLENPSGYPALGLAPSGFNAK